MRKISGHVVSTKPITLSRAAKLISRFAAVENGSSAAVSMYLQRTADAFNHLVQFHEKQSKIRNVDNSSYHGSVGKLPIAGADKALDGDKGSDSKNRAKKGDKMTVNNVDEIKRDEVEDSEVLVKERKKKRRKKNDEGDLKEKSSGKKKSRDEAVDS